MLVLVSKGLSWLINKRLGLSRVQIVAHVWHMSAASVAADSHSVAQQERDPGWSQKGV